MSTNVASATVAASTAATIDGGVLRAPGDAVIATLVASPDANSGPWQVQLYAGADATVLPTDPGADRFHAGTILVHRGQVVPVPLEDVTVTPPERVLARATNTGTAAGTLTVTFAFE